MRSALISSMFLALVVGISSGVHASPVPVGADPIVAANILPDAELVTINLNTADEVTLQRELSGIGAAKAKAIVAYREVNGNFATADELIEVKGVGKAIFEKNRNKIAVN